MPIEFAPAKRQATLENRGLDMAHAVEVFGGNTLSVEDTRQAYGETRWITVGFLHGRMVVWSGLRAARRGTPHHQLEEGK